MKRIVKQFDKKETGNRRQKTEDGRKGGFTIIELLTVMSIIVILIGLLVPALNMAKQYAKKVRQMAQFHSIDAAIELFNNEFDGYLPSDEVDLTGASYCGAMKLAEAMVGQDLLGFHPDSSFRRDGEGIIAGKNLYREPDWTVQEWDENLKSRKGPYLPLDNANAHKLSDMWEPAAAGDFDPCSVVLCDVYTHVANRSGQGKRKIGMPILYYKADISGTKHDPDTPSHPLNIYDYKDNHELVELGKPEDTDFVHPLFSVSGDPPAGRRFYEITKNEEITIDAGRPYRSDSYILLSAGFDGEYGTRDDLFNFNK